MTVYFLRRVVRKTEIVRTKMCGGQASEIFDLYDMYISIKNRLLV